MEPMRMAMQLVSGHGTRQGNQRTNGGWRMRVAKKEKFHVACLGRLRQQVRMWHDSTRLHTVHPYRRACATHTRTWACVYHLLIIIIATRLRTQQPRYYMYSLGNVSLGTRDTMVSDARGRTTCGRSRSMRVHRIGKIACKSF